MAQQMSVQPLADRSGARLFERLGHFAHTKFAAEKVLDIAEKLFLGHDLTLAEVIQLANNTSLPVLFKLVELISAEFHSGQPVKIRPVVFLPLAAWIEEDSASTVSRGSTYLTRLVQDIDFSEPLYLAIDRWTGGFALNQILEALLKIRREVSLDQGLFPVGPSTVEIDLLCRSKPGSPDREGMLQETLSQFKLFDVQSIEGGSDLLIHRRAAEYGFRLSVGQTVDCPSGPPNGRSAFTAEYLNNILFTKRELVPTKHLRTWFPWSLQTLDRKTVAAEPLGEQLLRAVGLGRLLLPEVPFIRAPLSLLGIKVAHVATCFGANDLGFAAVDTRSAESLGIARLSEVRDIVERHRQELLLGD